jgi:putative heme-binding domain-containing protein
VPLSKQQYGELAHNDKLRKLASSDKKLEDLIGGVLGVPFKPGPGSTDVEGWRQLADEGGDAAAGERIFFHPRSAGCSRCHQVDGRGGRIGPELSTTAPQLDGRKLIEAILEPSKEIAPRYVPWTIVTTEGMVLSGMLVSEAVNGEQTYADAEGRLFVLRPEQIDRREPHRKSIMPDKLVERLTVQEFRDLLAFLQSR